MNKIEKALLTGLLENCKRSLSAGQSTETWEFGFGILKNNINNTIGILDNILKIEADETNETKEVNSTNSSTKIEDIL